MWPQLVTAGILLTSIGSCLPPQHPPPPPQQIDKIDSQVLGMFSAQYLPQPRPPLTVSCAERKNGIYADLTSQCRSYYRCIDGLFFMYRCPLGEIFDEGKKECTVGGQCSIPSDENCDGRTDGMYASYRTDCRNYYRCTNQTLAGTHECPIGYRFDLRADICGPAYNVPCAPPTCLGLEDGLHALQGSSCHAYFRCSMGRPTLTRCPADAIFDRWQQKCVTKESGVCEDEGCVGEADGNHGDRTVGCRRYVSCKQETVTSYTDCPDGSVFHNSTCELAAPCAYKDACAGAPDGYKSVSRCHKYVLCKNERVRVKYSCPQRELFDGERCVPETAYTCSLIKASPLVRHLKTICFHRRSGYHSDVSSGCRHYYYCHNGRLLGRFTCPGTKVYNGKKCVEDFECANEV